MSPRRRSERGAADALRRQIAADAARLIADQGIRDYRAAKLKAAARFGPPDTLPLPRNTEIEEALREHQRLFQSASQPAHLARLRRAAIEAMRFFQDYQPRLVGPVLLGTADEYSAACLHVFTDSLGELCERLRAHGIPYDLEDRRLRVSRDEERTFPALSFRAGDSAIDLTVFPCDGLRQAPLDRIDERPMRRATLDAVLSLDVSPASS
jgi:hypothetical protein